jgi:anti-sigma B factor antagonist
MLTGHEDVAHNVEAAMATSAEPDRKWIGRSVDFAVDVESEPPQLRLVLKGELDLASAPLLERAIEALPWPELSELTLDLAGVRFIDSTGLSVLIRASHRAATADLRFSVVHAAAQPWKLFTIAGVIDSLHVEP